MDSNTPFLSTPAGFWIRSVAYLIDSVLISAVVLITSAVFGWPTLFDLWSTEVLLPGTGKMAAFGLLFGALYHAVMETSRWQTSIGKRTMGVRITNMDGERVGFFTAGLRYVVTVLATVFFPPLLIIVVLNKKKRGINDFIAGTRVYRSEGALPYFERGKSV